MYTGLTSAEIREGTERKFKYGIEGWYAATDGKLPLMSALERLCEAFDADAAGVSRYSTRSGIRPRLVSFDRRPDGAFVPPLTRAYTDCVLGEFARRARPGSIWHSSVVSDLDPALKRFQQRRALDEMLICPIGFDDDHHDYLELHFITAPTGDSLARIETTGLSLHRGWQGRTTGDLFERIIDSASQDRHVGDMDLLSCDNSMRLSRCEFRICSLYRQGLSNQAVLRELDITIATLRTHLRNIYVKIGVEGKAELIFRLLAANPAVPNRKSARR